MRAISSYAGPDDRQLSARLLAVTAVRFGCLGVGPAGALAAKSGAAAASCSVRATALRSAHENELHLLCLVVTVDG